MKYNRENLKQEHPLLIRIEKTDYRWLKSEAKKRKLSVAGFVRHILTYFRNIK